MMFKDKYVHKFYAFALAAVFALTLAGCGGGGGALRKRRPRCLMTRGWRARTRGADGMPMRHALQPQIWRQRNWLWSVKTSR